MGFHGTLLLLQLATGILAGVLLIQLDKVYQHLRTAGGKVTLAPGQELFCMPRIYSVVALALGLLALLVAGTAGLLAMGAVRDAAWLELGQAQVLALGCLALGGVPGVASYVIARKGNYRVRADGRGVLEFRNSHPYFLAWADLRKVTVDARGRRLILTGKDGESVHLECQVAGFPRLLALVLKRLPNAGTARLPLRYGRPDFRKQDSIRNVILGAVVLGLGLWVAPRQRWWAPALLAALAASGFGGPKRSPGSPVWIRFIKLNWNEITIGDGKRTVTMALEQLESAAIEDYRFRATAHLGTHIRTKDGRSLRVDAALADPFVLAPALQDLIQAPTLF